MTDHAPRRALTREFLEQLSGEKNEPPWMRAHRQRCLAVFEGLRMPRFGPDLSALDFSDLSYYSRPVEPVKSWEDLPSEIRRTFEALRLPEAEQKALAGLGAQVDSEVVYRSMLDEVRAQGVIFASMDTAIREYPWVQDYFMKAIPAEDNKFAALHGAVWSGGTFIWIPAGVEVAVPLQAYYRMQTEAVGQFEHTLIVAEPGSSVHYIEGCLPAGEQVSVGDRWVNIESLKPGDSVATETGRLAQVQAVMMRPYRGELVEVKPISPYNAFRLTPEHPVLAVRREDVVRARSPRRNWLPEVDSRKLTRAKPAYLPVGALRGGDFVVFPKIQAQGFNPDFSYDQLRLLGYYLAKGAAFVHAALNQPVVAFSLGERETSGIEEVKALIQAVEGEAPQVVREPDRHAITISACSRELMAFCLEHAGEGATTKRLSAEVMALPPTQLAPLLDAYFRGDGNTCWRGKSETRRVSTASETLARQTQELLARTGVYASVQVRGGGEDTIQGQRIRRKEQFTIVWTHGKRMGEVRDVADYFLVPIKGIRRIPYDGFVFNLDVEEPNTYLVRGFAAHNCSAPRYARAALHSGMVEIFAKEGARVRFTTVQNWSKNVYNLNNKRALAYTGAAVDWVSGSLGSKVTMLYPTTVLLGPGASTENLAFTFSQDGMWLDSGARSLHRAPDTTSRLISRSVVQGSGKSVFRGTVHVYPLARGAKAHVECSTLLLTPDAKTETIPILNAETDDVELGHEATVGRVSQDQLFYLMSRGLSEAQAMSLIVNGFVSPILKEIPLEYAVELRGLLEMSFEKAVG